MVECDWDGFECWVGLMFYMWKPQLGMAVRWTPFTCCGSWMCECCPSWKQCVLLVKGQFNSSDFRYLLIKKIPSWNEGVEFVIPHCGFLKWFYCKLELTCLSLKQSRDHQNSHIYDSSVTTNYIVIIFNNKNIHEIVLWTWTFVAFFISSLTSVGFVWFWPNLLDGCCRRH